MNKRIEGYYSIQSLATSNLKCNTLQN
jgi:hypothetical protein